MSKKSNLIETLWNLCCCVSLVGIWPRYIEPKLLSKKFAQIHLDDFPVSLNELKIVHISDLHLSSKTPTIILKKVYSTIKEFNPDLIFFTGDFLCYSRCADRRRLDDFILNFPAAQFGNYAVLGNHDYDQYVFLNEQGVYDCDTTQDRKISIIKGFKRLFHKNSIQKKFSDSLKKLNFNRELSTLLKKSPFKLLHNETELIDIRGSRINITGLGEYMAGQMRPSQAFQGYDSDHPGILLVHNPDSLAYLKEYPGQLAFCGHTHGGQINVPLLSKKFLLLENMDFKRGLIHHNGRMVYINRGLGGVINFRLFSRPEILCLKIFRKGDQS